jgi:hypothetical protein
MCGILVEVGPEDHGKQATCETCHRRYDIRISNDAPAGRRAVTLNYVASEDEASASATTVVPISAPRKAGGPDLIAEPEPPSESLIKCRCGVLLAVFRNQYEKRGRCPECGHRMLTFLLYDPSTRAYALQTFNLVDQSMGSTQILTKL